MTYAEMSTLEYLAVCYLVLVLCKIILCYASLGTATAVFVKRMHGTAVYRLVVAVVAIPFILLFLTPTLLRQEGYRFFLLYSKRKIIRDILSGIH